MELIDSHAHIDFPQFAEDRDAMLERARAAGVTTLLAIGTGPGPEKLDSALPFAEQHDWMYTDSGVNPIMLFGKRQRGIQLLGSRPGADGEKRRHASGARAIEHSFAVFRELRKINVRV